MERNVIVQSPVEPPDPPTLELFEVTPIAINVGQSVQVRWKATSEQRFWKYTLNGRPVGATGSTRLSFLTTSAVELIARGLGSRVRLGRQVVTVSCNGTIALGIKHTLAEEKITPAVTEGLAASFEGRGYRYQLDLVQVTSNADGIFIEIAGHLFYPFADSALRIDFHYHKHVTLVANGGIVVVVPISSSMEASIPWESVLLILQVFPDLPIALIIKATLENEVSGLLRTMFDTEFGKAFQGNIITKLGGTGPTTPFAVTAVTFDTIDIVFSICV